MAWTQSDLDRLETAIATGAKVVQYRDQRVEYQSTSEMLQARTIIIRSLQDEVRNFRLGSFRKGVSP